MCVCTASMNGHFHLCISLADFPRICSIYVYKQRIKSDDNYKLMRVRWQFIGVECRFRSSWGCSRGFPIIIAIIISHFKIPWCARRCCCCMKNVLPFYLVSFIPKVAKNQIFSHRLGECEFCFCRFGFVSSTKLPNQHLISISKWVFFVYWFCFTFFFSAL